MPRPIEIIDPEGSKRAKVRRNVVLVATVVSIALFGYAEARDYYYRWCALDGARKLASFLSTLKTRAIREKAPLEARFVAPDTIEINSISSCGPGGTRHKIEERKLSELRAGLAFAKPEAVVSLIPDAPPLLSRYCYDPMFGSSIVADGLAEGGIVIGHEEDLAAQAGEHLVLVRVQGASGDLSLD